MRTRIVVGTVSLLVVAGGSVVALAADDPHPEASASAASATVARTATSAPSWASGGGPRAATSGSSGTAYWVRPSSVEQLTGDADFVGAVRVLRVAPGKPLPTEAGTDVPALETQVVTLEVLEQWKGKAVKEIGVFKTGTDTKWMEEDPPYKAGQVYLLAATQRDEDGLFIPFGPEGRLEVRDAKVRTLTDTPVAATFANKPVEDAVDVLKEGRR